MYLRPGRLLPPCSWLTVGGPISQIKHTRAAIAGAGPLWPARVRMVLRHLMSVGAAYGALQRHRSANASKKNDIGGDSVGDPRSCCGSERTIVCDRKTVDEAAHPGPPAAQPAERRSGDEIGPPTAENTRALGASGRQSAVYTLFPGCQVSHTPGLLLSLSTLGRSRFTTYLKTHVRSWQYNHMECTAGSIRQTLTRWTMLCDGAGQLPTCEPARGLSKT